MGRISRAKIDQIGRLRRKGYLQREVAERLGLDEKTVRKYDPLRGIPASTQGPAALLDRLKSLEQRLSALETWRWIGATADEDGPYALLPVASCPACSFGWGRKPQESDLEYDERTDELVCTACHRRYPTVSPDFLG